MLNILSPSKCCKFLFQCNKSNKGSNIHELPENTLSCNLFPISICFLTHSHLFIQKRRRMSTNEKSGSRFFPSTKLHPFKIYQREGKGLKMHIHFLVKNRQAYLGHSNHQGVYRYHHMQVT